MRKGYATAFEWGPAIISTDGDTVDMARIDREVTPSDVETFRGRGSVGLSLAPAAYKDGDLSWLALVRPVALTIKGGGPAPVPQIPEKVLSGLIALDLYSGVALTERIATESLADLVLLTADFDHLSGALAQARQLKSASLDNVRSTSLDFLSEVECLEYLDIALARRMKDPVISLHFPSPLPELREIQIEGGFVSSLDGLVSTPALERLTVIPPPRARARQMELSLLPLAGLQRLSWVVIERHGTVRALDVLDRLPAIERVLLDGVDKRWDR